MREANVFVIAAQLTLTMMSRVILAKSPEKPTFDVSVFKE